ncbi:MAG: hypothetical protein ABFD84_03470, partial [Candidatus Polarisedimenticolia bacterium]
PAPQPEERDAQGQTAFDRRVEEALLKGKIVEQEALSDGITHPVRLTLRHGGVELRAVYKNVDEETRGATRSTMIEEHFTDRYVYEVAAYRLDRLLGLGFVPPTVLREVDGKRGSVQYWIEDAVSLGEMITAGRQPRNVERFRVNKISMNVLDALIYNIDRRPVHILIAPADESFYLIDHTRSFRENKDLPPFLVDWDGTLDPALAARLRDLKDGDFRAVLEGLVTEKQIKALLVRRERLLRKLAAVKLLPAR